MTAMMAAKGLSKIILFGERSLRRALGEYVEHYHAERNHQGKGPRLVTFRVRDWAIGVNAESAK